MVNFKIHDVTTGEQTIALHILPNISRSKSNHTMKFVQLTEYSKINIFFFKKYAEMRQGDQT